MQRKGRRSPCRDSQLSNIDESVPSHLEDDRIFRRELDEVEISCGLTSGVRGKRQKNGSRQDQPQYHSNLKDDIPFGASDKMYRATPVIPFCPE